MAWYFPAVPQEGRSVYLSCEVFRSLRALSCPQSPCLSTFAPEGCTGSGHAPVASSRSPVSCGLGCLEHGLVALVAAEPAPSLAELVLGKA